MNHFVSIVDIKWIKRHEDILINVIEDINGYSAYYSIDIGQIQKSIEYLKDEIKEGKTEDLPALFYQMEQQYNLLEKFSRPVELPDKNSPYFAHMKLLENGKEREIFLGHVAFIPKGRNYRIVNWTKAPIAQIYYNYREGEEYELDLPNKTIEGLLVEKNIVTIKGGKLVRLDKNNQSYVIKDNSWIQIDNNITSLGGGEGQAFRKIDFGTGMTDFESPEVISLLDKEQFKLLDLNVETSILLTGGAGSGKTTVALHRIAKLCFNKRIPAKDVLVIVPQVGLVVLSRKILNSVGLNKVRVITGKEWFRNQCIQLFVGICKKVCIQTPFRVSLLKRDRGIINVLEAFIKRKKIEICDRLKKKGVDCQISANRPLLSYLRWLRYNGITPIQKILVEELISELENYNGLREDMFKDKTLLSLMLESDNEFINQRTIDETIKHTYYQFKDVDNDRIDRQSTLDERHVKFGTPEEIHGTIDHEDYPILLLLCNALNGHIISKKGPIKLYRHIVIDEAQEISPIESRVFGHIIHPDRGSFTIAGDMAQKIDPTSGFTGWDDTLRDLGEKDAKIKTLEVSYRSPQAIVDLSHHVLGNLAPIKKPKSSGKIGGVISNLGGHEAQVLIMINEALENLLSSEHRASVAIICNELETALRYKNGLQGLDKVRLVEFGDFSFRPGVDITTVEQVKGLEFDYVIIPDLDSTNYPVNDVSRRRLHLAMTRAIHQLWILSSGNFSHLVPTNF